MGKNQRVSFIFQNPGNHLKRESQLKKKKKSREEMKEWGRKYKKRKEKIKRKGRKRVLLSYRHVLLPLTV